MRYRELSCEKWTWHMMTPLALSGIATRSQTHPVNDPCTIHANDTCAAGNSFGSVELAEPFQRTLLLETTHDGTILITM